MSINAQNITRVVLMMLVAPALLSGCVSRDISDLESYAEDVLSRKGGTIEPLPPIKPYIKYVYQAGEQKLRTPFETYFNIREIDPETGPVGGPEQEAYQNEIATHNREELEAFPLDSLRMVGVLENEESLWGIIRDSGGVVHRVQVGNYIGTNYGKITNIQEDGIDLRELTRDVSSGLWEEREARVALSEE